MAVEFKDYYKALGISRDASEADIKKAFRKLARQHHPDVAKDKAGAESRFKEINEAYEVLGDPEKRRRYDELGAQWQHEGAFRPPPGFEGRPWSQTGPDGGRTFEFHFGGTGFSDFFERFFGGGAAGGLGSFADRFSREDDASWAGEGGLEARRGRDVEGDILVTLHEVLRGSERVITLQRSEPVPGKAQTHSIRVRIPAGVQEGQLIRVAGKGGEGREGGAPGDLFLRVRYAQHPDLRARGVDLYQDVELAPWEAVLGGTLSVFTLEGQVTVKVPAGTSQGCQMRLRGRGLPRGKGGQRGDMFVVIRIEVPTQVTERERLAWETLARESTFNPRKT